MTTNTKRPQFPHTIDSTMLSTFRSCPQKYFRQYLEHWKPREESVHLVAGKAFAEGIEKARVAFYVDRQSAEDAVLTGLQALLESYGNFEPPRDSAKTADRMAGALEFYFSQYPLDAIGGAKPITLAGNKRGIEFSFAEPLPFNHPVTNDPILYTGRADMVADFAGGVYVYDEKTTSSLGPSWAKQWEHRSQFTGYSWAARQAGIPVSGSVVRGVSILKTKYDTQEVITFRADWEIERWLRQVVSDLERLKLQWERGWFDYSLDGACNDYGGCSLATVCKSKEPETWLPVYFTKRVWDPLLRKEISVEEFERQWETGGEGDGE